MSDERDRFILEFMTRGLEQAQSDVTRSLGRISETVNALDGSGTKDLSEGLMQARKAAEAVRAELGRLAKVRVEGSSSNARMPVDLQKMLAESIQATRVTPGDRMTRVGLAQLQAQINRMKVEARAEIPVGGTIDDEGRYKPYTADWKHPKSGETLAISSFANETEKMMARLKASEQLASAYDAVYRESEKGLKAARDLAQRDTKAGIRAGHDAFLSANIVEAGDLATQEGKARQRLNDALVKEANARAKHLELVEMGVDGERRARARAELLQAEDRTDAARSTLAAAPDRDLADLRKSNDAVGARIAADFERMAKDERSSQERRGREIIALERRREKERLEGERQIAQWTAPVRAASAVGMPMFSDPDVGNPAGKLQSQYNAAERAMRTAAERMRELEARGSTRSSEYMSTSGAFENARSRARQIEERLIEAYAPKGQPPATAAKMEAEARERREKIEKAAAAADEVALPYARPDLTTDVGRKQHAVNQATYDAAIARTSAERINLESTKAEERLRSSRSLAAANARLAKAEIGLAEALEEQRRKAGGAGVRGFMNDFRSGFRGNEDIPVAQQFGQTARFSAYYGLTYRAIQALTTTLQTTVQEGIEFQQGMSELALATGRPTEQLNSLANQLGNEALKGGLAPSEGLAIGGRSVGLFGAAAGSGATASEQARIAEISTRVVSRMKMGSDRQTVDLQNEISAIAKAFGTGPEGQFRVYDLDAYMSRKFGVTPGSTLEAVAQSASVGQSAGFSQEEINAMAAALISGTGQTGSAVGGYLAQIFSRGGEGTIAQLAGKYGIDTNLTLDKQIDKLAEVYKNASANERTAISAGAGRGKVQNAMEVLLQNWDAVKATADRSTTESAGAGDKAYQTRLNNVAGQITLITGEFKMFASQLGQSGLLEVLGGGIVIARKLLEAGTNMLELWNGLNGATRALIAVTAAAVAMKRTEMGSAAVDRLAGLSGWEMTGDSNAGRGKAATMGALNVAGLVAGALTLSEIKSMDDRVKAANQTLDRAFDAKLGPDATVDQLRARAAEFSASEADMRDSTGGWLGFMAKYQFAPGPLKTDREVATGRADLAKQEADHLMKMAKEQEEAQRAAGVIRSFSTDSLTESLDAITRAGGSAGDRLEAVRAALKGIGEVQTGLASPVESFQVGNLATALRQTGKGAVTHTQTDMNNWTALANGAATVTGTADLWSILSGNGRADKPMFGEQYNAAGRQWEKERSSTVIEKRLTEGMEKLGIKDWNQLDEGAAEELARRIVGDFELDNATPKAQEQAREIYRAAIAEALLKRATDFIKELDPARALTVEENTSLLDRLASDGAADMAALPESALTQRVKRSRKLMRDAQGLKDRAYEHAGPGEELQWGNGNEQTLQQLNREYAAAVYAQQDELRKAAQQKAKTKAEAREVGMGFVQTMTRVAIETGDQDMLVKLVKQAGFAGMKVVKQSIQDALNAAKAAQAMRAMMLAMGNAMAANMPDMGNSIAQYQGMLTTLEGTAVEGSSLLTGEGVFGSPAEASKPKQDPEEARQKMLALRNTLYLLSIDITDPLAKAVAAVKDARRRLASAREAGRPRDEVAEARLNLKQAQAEREATAFSQRLSAVQTAEQLGRISHAKYIQYLESESKRLNNIKNRTFQQQEQLNQIDLLLKEASSQMQGMWNFGDIKLPTPYQVRRYLEEEKKSYPTASSMVTNHNQAPPVTFYINGADIAVVKRVIRDEVGRNARTMTSAPRKR